MALDSFSYDFIEQVREYDQLSNLYYVERITVEANTRGVDVTPILRLEATDYALDVVNTTVRDLVEIDVNRIGPLSRLNFSPVLGIQWYKVAVVLRPLTLGLKLVARNLRTVFPGRSSRIAAYLQWDVNPFSLPEDARNQHIIVRYVYLDLKTGAQTITPELIFNDGSSQLLRETSQPTRAVVEYPVLTSKRIQQLKLHGDFTNTDNVIYDVEMDCYLPMRRRMHVA